MSDIFADIVLPCTIPVKVTPRAKKEYIKRESLPGGGTLYKVYVHAAPDGGKANAAVVEIIAAECGVPKSSVTIVTGHTSRNKTIRILP